MHTAHIFLGLLWNITPKKPLLANRAQTTTDFTFKWSSFEILWRASSELHNPFPPPQLPQIYIPSSWLLYLTNMLLVLFYLDMLHTTLGVTNHWTEVDWTGLDRTHQNIRNKLKNHRKQNWAYVQFMDLQLATTQQTSPKVFGLMPHPGLRGRLQTIFSKVASLWR